MITKKAKSFHVDMEITENAQGLMNDYVTSKKTVASTKAGYKQRHFLQMTRKHQKHTAPYLAAPTIANADKYQQDIGGVRQHYDGRCTMVHV